MKRIPKPFFVTGIAMLASVASAQESSSKKTEPKKTIAAKAIRLLGAPRDITQRELGERRDAILAEDWLKAAPWFTNYAQAREAAARGSRRILTYFTRSYSP